MNIMVNIRVALRALKSNMLRSFLTVLGIVIGVASVVALLGVGRGATASITDRVAGMGSNLISISAQMRFGPGGGSSSASVLFDDYEMMQANVEGIASITPVYTGQLTVSSSTRTSNYSVSGVTPNYLDVRSYEIAEGRFISEEDYLANKQVAVLGSTVAEDIFEGLSPIGRKLKIKSVEFTVIGVFAESGSSGGMSSGDDIIIVPLSTGYGKLFGSSAMSNGQQTVSTIYISAASAEVVDQVISDCKLVLRSEHALTLTEDLPFSVSSQAQALEALSAVSGTLTIFLGAIAAISLLVGGIGIMNIELVSVTERTREIGLRKAVGATRKAILFQFLVETMTLSILGGVIGVILGSLIAMVFTWTGLITAKITFDVIALAFFSAVFIGLFFGLYPAYQASKLRPIEALRYE
jgi:putative ABC transport system permease protein